MSRRLPSPALVLAAIALVAALGGSAIAGSALTKKKVNMIITKRAPELAVASARSADVATSAHSAGTATTARRAENAIWAVVRDDAGAAAPILVRASVPEVRIEAETGVDVDFGRDISGCTWIANKSSVDQASVQDGWAQTRLAFEQPTAVNVRTRDEEGQLDQDDFHPLVVC